MPNPHTPLGRPRAPRVLNTAALSIYQTTADTAPARRALLRQFLHEHELTPTALARQIGLSTANSFYNFLHGRSNALSQPILELIAKHFPALPVTPQPGDAMRLTAVLSSPLRRRVWSNGHSAFSSRCTHRFRCPSPLPSVTPICSPCKSKVMALNNFTGRDRFWSVGGYRR